jgi:hypothetical protein
MAAAGLTTGSLPALWFVSYIFSSRKQVGPRAGIMFSFQTGKKLNEIRGFIRQLVDLTSPNLPPLGGDSRAESRSNRALPALLVPWENRRPVVDESTYALTRNLSDHGLALVLQQPFRSDQVVVGLWLQRPRFALGGVRQNAPLGGGFWQLGVELTELLDPAELPQMEPLVPLCARLVPPLKACAR